MAPSRGGQYLIITVSQGRMSARDSNFIDLDNPGQAQIS